MIHKVTPSPKNTGLFKQYLGRVVVGDELTMRKRIGGKLTMR